MSQKILNNSSNAIIQIPSSFFDDTIPIKTLWESAKNLSNLKIDFSANLILIQGYFFKKKKSSNIFKKRFYTLYSEYFTYKKVCNLNIYNI